MADGVANNAVDDVKDGVKDDARTFLWALLCSVVWSSTSQKTAKQAPPSSCCGGGAAAEAIDSVVREPLALKAIASGCRQRSVCKGVKEGKHGVWGRRIGCMRHLPSPLAAGVASFLDWLRLIAQGEGSRELGGQLGVNTYDSRIRRNCVPQSISGSKSKMQRRSI